MFKRWLSRSALKTRAKSAEQKFGCRMASARLIPDAERPGLAERIEQLGPWFHNYEIASGVWTNPLGQSPGVEYPLTRWQLIEPLLPDVQGKACLDIGCSSGFFSLKLKELGAAYVLGIDSGEQLAAIEQAQFAANTLQLDVDFRVLSAYDLATIGRQFDLVLFMGVFYHLRHPLVALEAARSVCRDTMMFQTITTKHERKLSELDTYPRRHVGLHSSVLESDDFPGLRFVEGSLDDDVTCWFVPNLQAVVAMLRSTGFNPGELAFANERDVIVRCTVTGS